MSSKTYFRGIPVTEHPVTHTGGTLDDKPTFPPCSAPLLLLLMLYRILHHVLAYKPCFEFCFLGKPWLRHRIWGPVEMILTVNRDFGVIACRRHL